MNKERLELLYNHISTLDDKLWDFGSFVQDLTPCGTVGCALGHCPDLWPNDWKIEPYETLKGGSLLGRIEDTNNVVSWQHGTFDGLASNDLFMKTERFFGMDFKDSRNLFTYDGFSGDYEFVVTKELWLEKLRIYIDTGVLEGSY